MQTFRVKIELVIVLVILIYNWGRISSTLLSPVCLSLGGRGGGYKYIRQGKAVKVKHQLLIQHHLSPKKDNMSKFSKKVKKILKPVCFICLFSQR